MTLVSSKEPLLAVCWNSCPLPSSRTFPQSPVSTCDSALWDHSCQAENMMGQSPSSSQTTNQDRLPSPSSRCSYYPTPTVFSTAKLTDRVVYTFCLHHLSSDSFLNPLQLDLCLHSLIKALVEVAKDRLIAGSYRRFSGTILLGPSASPATVDHLKLSFPQSLGYHSLRVLPPHGQFFLNHFFGGIVPSHDLKIFKCHRAQFSIHTHLGEGQRGSSNPMVLNIICILVIPQFLYPFGTSVLKARLIANDLQNKSAWMANRCLKFITSQAKLLIFPLKSAVMKFFLFQ